MERRYRIFLSSTESDLKAERRAVIEKIMEMGHIPIAMEHFPGSARTSWDYVEGRIKLCDYVLVIVAGKYGTQFENGISFTRREYQCARDHGIPTVGLLICENAFRKLPASKIENDLKVRKKIQDFRMLFENNHNGCKFAKWSTKARLRDLIEPTLNQMIKEDERPTPGLVSANSVIFSEKIPEDQPYSARALRAMGRLIDQNLGLVGFYRDEQEIVISLERESDGRFVLELTFSSVIMPVQKDLYIEVPEINNIPKGLIKLGGFELEIDGELRREKLKIPIKKPSRDRLRVRYKLDSPMPNVLGDTHTFRSPVLAYSVRFKTKKVDKVRCEIDKIVGPGDPVGIERVTQKNLTDGDDFETHEFKDAEGALGLQGFKWTIHLNNLSST